MGADETISFSPGITSALVLCFVAWHVIWVRKIPIGEEAKNVGGNKTPVPRNRGGVCPERP